MPVSIISESIVLVLLIVVAITVPGLGDRLFRRIELLGSRVAVRRGLCCGMIAAIVLLLRASLLPIWNLPRPKVHDEFAYLLGAATFAAGRMTNPSPKCWQFFEAPHILVVPTYQSIYPPAQALAMAAGKVLFGHPWFGVLLSCAAMSGAICWMLQGWIPSRWALLGGLLSLVRLSIDSYWMNSYWGGAVAAIGGCLVMGAYPRITRRAQMGYSWAMGAGLLILVNSRPFEGGMTSLPIGIAMLHWLAKEHGATLRTRLLGVAAPLACCALAGTAFFGYYNHRVTGDAAIMPYREGGRQYEHLPILPIFEPDNRKIVYHSADMQYQFETWDRGVLQQRRDDYVQDRWRYVVLDDHETLGLLLIVPLVMIPWVLRDRRIRLMLVCLLIAVLLLLVEHSAWLHYAAPQMGSFFGLLVQCIRHARATQSRRVRSAGRFFSRMLPIASVVCFAGFGIYRGRQTGWTEPLTPVQRRPELETLLEQKSRGNVIVFVRYRFDSQYIVAFEDWNYNSPDPDDAPVLWLHDMGPTEDGKALAAYPNRTPWYVTVDCSKPPVTLPEYSRYDGESH